MADDTPPQWAFYRVAELSEDAPTYRVAFAHYIAQHEQPPVDPLLVEARAIVAAYCRDAGLESWAASVEAGSGDEGHDVSLVLAALRRGVEIGKGD